MDSAGNSQGQELDPQLDENGFPQNDEYLIAQGLTPSALNREYLNLQDEYNQFLQAVMNPQTRAQALAAFDQQLAQGRPQFPGQPGQPLPPGQDYSQALRAIQSGVNPPDGSLLQNFNQLPPEQLAIGLLQNLSEYLPPELY